jgi:hypothetical protein
MNNAKIILKDAVLNYPEIQQETGNSSDRDEGGYIEDSSALSPSLHILE